MGAVKLDARTARKDPHHTVEKLFADAFGPWPSLFRRTSWCGWRPVDDSYALKQMLSPILPGSDSKPVDSRFSQELSMNETVEGLSIVVPLPRMIRESLCLEISDNVLIVTGEQVEDLPQVTIAKKSNNAQRQFRRVITLPNHVRSGSIRARLCGSMLKIDIPREE